jgi:hypothetical protein
MQMNDRHDSVRLRLAGQVIRWRASHRVCPANRSLLYCNLSPASSSPLRDLRRCIGAHLRSPRCSCAVLRPSEVRAVLLTRPSVGGGHLCTPISCAVSMSSEARCRLPSIASPCRTSRQTTPGAPRLPPGSGVPAGRPCGARLQRRQPTERATRGEEATTATLTTHRMHQPPIMVGPSEL